MTMKKILGSKNLFFMLLFSFIFLSACSNESAGTRSNTITDAELTDREEWLVFNLSDQSFVYDYTVDSEYSEVEVYIEKYIFGEKQQDKVTHLLMDTGSSGSLIFTISKPVGDTGEKLFTVGINSDESMASVSAMEKISVSDAEAMATIWESVSSEGRSIDVSNGEVVLASIAHGSGEGGMRSISSEFYEDVEGNIEEIEEYEVVYLLKTLFIE